MNVAVLGRYDAYKDSGVTWLGDIPAGWKMCRLKELAFIQNSNVDKKSHENEIPVLLCNYVDVYKNNFITASLNFMKATANESEIQRFEIKKDDVLITKDSETCDDIAMPALCLESLEGVLCGYHLAQFRTNKKLLLGAYLLRLFQSKSYGFRFVVSAKGITRVGLGQSAITDSLTPIPPLAEQRSIVNYLDTKTTQIDRKIELLSQKAEKYSKLKQSLINEAVTRGLEKSVPMKDSYNEWQEELPINWSEKRVKDLFKLVTDMAPNNNNHELLSVYASIGVRPRKDLEQRGNKASSTDGYWLVKKGDIIVNKLLAWMGGIGLSEYDGVTSPAYDILRKTNIEVCERYYGYLFRTEKAKEIFKRYSRGIMDMRLRLYFDKFGGIRISVPPLSEQQAIAVYLDEKTAKINRIVETVHSQINNLKELRKTLINDVVTGKIMVVE